MYLKWLEIWISRDKCDQINIQKNFIVWSIRENNKFFILSSFYARKINGSKLFANLFLIEVILRGARWLAD